MQLSETHSEGPPPLSVGDYDNSVTQYCQQTCMSQALTLTEVGKSLTHMWRTVKVPIQTLEELQ